MWKPFLLFLLFLSVTGFSQKSSSFHYENKELIEVLNDLEDSFDIKFSYLDDLLTAKRISIQNGLYNLPQLLSMMENETGLLFYEIDSRYYAIIQKEKNPFEEANFLKEVVIHGYLTEGIMKQKDNSFKIFPRKMEVLPGLTEPDILQSIQQLPGVISPNETATGLHVRGGTPDQNLILWDGITMYHNGHLFGMISGFNPNIVESVSFINKGTNAQYGGRVSSVIDIKTNDKIPQKTELNFGLNALNADMDIAIPIVGKKLAVQLSGRRSFTDLYQSYTYDRLYDKVFQNTKIIKENRDSNRFYFQDYEAKIKYHLSKRDFIAISTINIFNDLDNRYVTTDESAENRDEMDISNLGYCMHWQRTWNPNFHQKLSAHYSKYRLNYVFTQNYQSPEDNFDIFSKKNKILDSGISLLNFYTISSKTKLDFGYQLSSFDVSHAFTSKNPFLNFILDDNSAFIQTHSLFTTSYFTFSKNIRLQAGARFNYYPKFEKSVLEPRVNFSFNLLKDLSLSFTAETKNQIISQIKETVVSDLSLENQLWVLSDLDKYPIIKANQFTTGALFKKNNWTFDLETYYKHITGLTTLTLGFLNNLDPNRHIGESTSKGLDFYVKKDFNHVKTWFTYSMNETKNNFNSINNDLDFPNNSEIKHAVAVSVAYKINHFQLASGWYWHTGKPYTLTNIVDNELVYSQINGERLPAYHRLDLSFIYNFNLSNSTGTKGKLGFSVYNLYNRKNLLNKEYTVTQSPENIVEISDKYSLRMMPNFFVRFSL